MDASLKHDISTISTVSISTLSKFVKQINWCITDAVCKSTYSGDTETNIDIGIGRLIIKYDNEQVKYRFEPSQELDNAVVAAIVDEQNPLVDNLEESLIEKITNAYKSFF